MQLEHKACNANDSDSRRRTPDWFEFFVYAPRFVSLASHLSLRRKNLTHRQSSTAFTTLLHHHHCHSFSTFNCSPPSFFSDEIDRFIGWALPLFNNVNAGEATKRYAFPFSKHVKSFSKMKDSLLSYFTDF
ncbi:hypothetical protein L1887_22603 [Cichorium endivia]|nr:hypothetical protein L1887_22603 [Cichorium endivia]